ncbi:MAG: ABC transporter permease [Weeksellaceae bacterium]|nr:ABC transporter permease [Weeksellaceae bacterium]
MRNLAFYIARRYNTYTLLISLILIIISAFTIGVLNYIGSSSFQIIQEIVYPNTALSTFQSISLYLFSFLYIGTQIIIIYWIFNRWLKGKKLKFKFISSLVITLFSGLISYGITLFNTGNSIIYELLSLIFISIGLLSLIFGLLTYLFSRTRITGVNIITSIAVFAITIGTSALFIILSVFSGIEKMNLQFLSNVNPDLRILPKQGKVIPDIDDVVLKLAENESVSFFSKVIEEKVSIEFDNKQDIAYIKGVDENYNKVIRIDTTIVHGNYFDFQHPYEILASDGVARRLQMYIDYEHTSRLLMPKPGSGLITSEEEAFNSAVANPIGVFIINDQFDRYVFSPIGLTQTLLQLDENQAYFIELKLKQGASPEMVKSNLQKELGNSVVVQTRKDIDATFLKVMNIENLITYLIFTLVIIISSFNLAGAIIIIIIDKKEQIKTMRSFGMRTLHIKQIFFQTGQLITVFSILFGLFLGTVIGLLQNQFHLVMANPFVPFPFEFTWINYLAVIMTVLVIGGFVSWLTSRKLPN